MTTTNPNPYVEKYGTPDFPAYVGQHIDSSGEFQFLPDGTLAVADFHGTSYRVTQKLHKPGREVIVCRKDGSTTTFDEDQFTTTDRDLTMLHIRLVYVPTDT